MPAIQPASANHSASGTGERRPWLPVGTLAGGVAYLWAVAGVAAGWALREALTAWIGPGLPLYITFYPAVTVTALLAGFGPGLLATVLSALAVAYRVLPATAPSMNPLPAVRIGFVLFLGMGGLISLLAERYRRDRDKAARCAREAALRQDRQLLETVVRHSPAGICVIRGSDLRIQLVNPAYQAIAPGKSMPGRTLDDLWPETGYPFTALCRQVLATGEPHEVTDQGFSISRQPGCPVEPAWFNWSLHRVQLPGDEGWALLNTCWETTRAKQTEDQLRELSQRLSYHVDHSPLAVIEWGPDMRLIRWSGEAERLFGWTAEEVLGKRMEDFRWIYQEDLTQVDQVRADLTSGANPRRFSANRNYRKDGTVVECEWYNSSLLDPSGRLRSILSLVLDVTDRVRMQASLKEEARRKDDFLALLGHELRNPLMPIGNALQLLRLAAQDSQAAERACGIIERQVAQLGRLVDDLLDISRISRGMVHLRKEEIDLVEAVACVIADYRPVLEARGLRLEASLPAEPVRMEADRARIIQAVGNLLQNALKFTDPGGVIRLTVGREGPEQVLVRVADNGAGVPSGQLPNLFKPFMQEKGAIGRSRSGLGLGLALVKGLAELHGGSVEACSAGTGLGSTFTLRLPALAPAASEAPPPPVPAPETGPRSRRILVIEDMADAALTLQLLLQYQGHTVEVAFDGRTGIELATDFQPEIILCDIGLPGGLDGYAVARKLRASPGRAGVHLIAMTGFGTDEDRDQALAAGFNSHLVKPVDPSQLGPLIEAIPAPAVLE